MENGHKDAASTKNGPLIMPFNEGEHAISPGDIMNRRLKNRERQRRYRARKRLEADMKAARNSNQSTSPQLQLQFHGNLNACATRVHSKRNWKKDARTAHMSNGIIASDPTSASGSQALCLPSGVHVQPPLECETQSLSSSVLGSSEIQRSTFSRRHWKAEARSKKN